MPPHETAPQLFRELRVARRRLWSRELLHTAAAAVPAAAVASVALRGAGAPAILSVAVASIAVGGAAAAWLVSRRPRWAAPAAARAIERACPASRNLVITAEELARHADRGRPWIRDHVFTKADVVARQVDRGRAVPLRASIAATIVSCVIGLAVPIVASGTRGLVRDGSSPEGGTTRAADVSDVSIEATVNPPAYAREPRRTLNDPDRIEALQGSRLGVLIKTKGSWRVRLGTSPLPVRASNAGARVELILEENGYLAIEPLDGGASVTRRLVPLTAVSDRAPAIRIETPGKDVLLANTKPVVGVLVSAADDFGLDSLELRYTKASGSGEQFEFKEGTLPLQIAPESDRAWNARATISPAALGLAPGDAIIYRVVGRDRRPGDAGLASSDTFFIEVAGPGQVAVAGFELPPDTDRYALSQQMIVLKLERLRAREQTLDRETLQTESGNIAAEQRAVRANFVFLMGGTVEDEEQEAEHSHEIQEGRLENTARKDIVTAIQHMSRVERELAIVSTVTALPPARAAVEALQRAFGRNRYFLRTLPTRSRLDVTRRLTGDLSRASDSTREVLPAMPDRATSAARSLVADLLDLASSVRAGSVQPGALTSLAEQALAVDPAAREWQAISKSLLQLRDALGRSESERFARLNAAMALAGAIAGRDAVGTRSTGRDDPLQSAWAEERRR